MNYYSVCTVSLVTQQSRMLWNMYQRINGTQNERYDTLVNLPAYWIDACDVIRRECYRIDKAREEQQKRETSSSRKNVRR